MLDIQNQIDAGLERAFAKHGFAEPNIETLRKATGVSLRTLYKYVPSRNVMILRALEHRHRHLLALSNCFISIKYNFHMLTHNTTHNEVIYDILKPRTRLRVGVIIRG